MNTPLNDLTALAHQLIRPMVPSDGIAVDATAGNGHDTAFLARLVGPNGRVYAWDVQEDAVVETLKKLEQEEVAEQVSVRHAGHEKWGELLPDEVRGRIHAVMFNLGYRPHSDRQIATQAETTRIALRSAEQWLAPGGVISVLAYRGHKGGPEEAAAVDEWARALPADAWQTLRCMVPNASEQSPVLTLAVRHKHAGLG